MRGRDQFHFTDPSSLHKRKDGQLLVRHLRWKFVRLPHEDYFFGVYRPLEKVHVAKEFQGLPQASLQVLKVDQQGICHEVDDSITALLGYHPSEVIGRSFESFFEKPAELQFKNNIAKRLSSFMHNKHLIRRDGSKLQVDVLISPIPQADGEVKAYGVYWIDRDLQTARA